MKISFYVAPTNNPNNNPRLLTVIPIVNMIKLQEIKDQAELNTITSLTQNSGLLFNAISEDENPYNLETISPGKHCLTIYLPDWDENSKPYNDFKYLFTHATYLKWKKEITTKFPELSDQLPAAEEKAINIQELYRLQENYRRLQDILNVSGENHPIPEIESLQKRIIQLREEIYPKTKREVMQESKPIVNYSPSKRF